MVPVNLETLSNDNLPCRVMMELGTHHFDILQCISCWRHRIGLGIDVRHIAPIVHFITDIDGRSVGIAEDESEHVSAIDHSFEVIYLRFLRWIPGAIEARTDLLHTWDFG